MFNLHFLKSIHKLDFYSLLHKWPTICRRKVKHIFMQRFVWKREKFAQKHNKSINYLLPEFLINISKNILGQSDVDAQ